MHIVILIDHGYVSGGQAKVAVESALGLQAAGNHVTVFAGVGPVDPRLAQAGVAVDCLDQQDLLTAPRAVSMVRGIWNEPARRRLAALLQRMPRGDTIVHVHGWAKSLSPSIAGALRGCGLPVVYTMHEYFLLCPNGAFFNYPLRANCDLTPGSVACARTNCDSRSYAQKLWRFARHTAMTQVARLPQVFTDICYVTEFQVPLITPHLAPGTVLHHLPNPVGAVDRGPKADPTSGDVVFIGRLSEEKGPLLFAEAARRAGITPVFIGDGPLRETLTATYPEARCLGWKSGNEALDLLRSARAMVFPSLWYEAQGLVVWEALAAGTPVIVSDNTAAREAVEPGGNGLLFRSGDADDLAAKLEMLKDDNIVTRLSRRAYEAYWANPPDLDAHVARATAIYRQILARPTAVAAA